MPMRVCFLPKRENKKKGNSNKIEEYIDEYEY